MKINVRLFGQLSPYGKDSGGVLDVPEGTVMGQLPELMNFSAKNAAMYFVGEERVEQDRVLKEGDEIKIFPPITGG